MKIQSIIKVVTYTPGTNSRLDGGGRDNTRAQVIHFYPGTKYHGNLYKWNGSVYEPVTDGSVFSSKGKIIVNYYDNGSNILTSDDWTELTYIPGTSGSLTYSGKKAQIQNSGG